jgi:hypothetical protein
MAPRDAGVDVVALARGPRAGLYYITAEPPHCGAVRVKLVELPTDIEPPFRASLFRAQRGVMLLNMTRVRLDEFLLSHLDHVIEGEVKDGLLSGVVCNRRVRIRVLDRSVSGPVLALVPVASRVNKLPPLALTLYAYRLQLV